MLQKISTQEIQVRPHECKSTTGGSSSSATITAAEGDDESMPASAAGGRPGDVRSSSSRNRDPYYNRTGLIDLDEIKKNGGGGGSGDSGGGIPTSAGAKLRHQVGLTTTCFFCLHFVKKTTSLISGWTLSSFIPTPILSSF